MWRHVIIALLALTCAYAQLVGPDADGATFLYFNNYSSVLRFYGPHPSCTFYPVIGGSEIAYIRYDDWAAFNLTKAVEVDANNNPVATQNLLGLTWRFSATQDTDNATGNTHYIVAMHANMTNGASVSVFAESWSHGISKPYGLTQNNVSASSLEISFNITNWPFQSTTHAFRVYLGVSLYQFAVPGQIDRTNPFQYKGTVITPDITFNIWLMTYGFLDGVFTRMTSDVPLSSFTSNGFSFVLETGYFNHSMSYDPNFEVLLDVNPDCSSLGNCHNGFCAKDNVCVCKRGWAPPDCSKISQSNSTTDQGGILSPPKDDTISTTTIIGVVVGVGGGVVLVTGALILYGNRRRFKRFHAREVL